MKAKVAVLAAFVLVFPASASATESVNDPLAPVSPELTRSLDVGYQYWFAHGVTPIPRDHLIVHVRENLDTVTGERALASALMPGPHMWIDTAYLMFVTAREPDRTWAATVRRSFCAVIVHELGHTAGLAHADAPFPVMSATHIETPWACRLAFPMPRARQPIRRVHRK